MTQVLGLTVEITAANADEVIAKLKGIGATARGEASEGVSAFERQFEGVVDRMLERLAVLELAWKAIEWAKLTGEADEANKRLAASMDMVGARTEAMQEQLEATLAPLERMGFYTRSQLNDALSQLIALTGNAKASMGSLDVVVDLARFRHLDLATAALYVSKAMEGEVGMLGRYIPGLKDAGDKMAFLREHLQIFAETDATSLAGAFDRIITKVKDVAEDFGLAIAGTTNWQEAVDKLLPKLDELGKWLDTTGIKDLKLVGLTFEFI